MACSRVNFELYRIRSTQSEVQKLFLISRSHIFREVCDELIETTYGIKLSGAQNKRKDDDSRYKMSTESRSSLRAMLLLSVKIVCCDRRFRKRACSHLDGET
jgi:hypothetical protein